MQQGKRRNDFRFTTSKKKFAKITKKLEPLYALMKRHLKTGSVMQMDETTMQMMDEPEENQRRSFLTKH
jgi:CTP-dependent riboflavin kinase